MLEKFAHLTEIVERLWACDNTDDIINELLAYGQSQGFEATSVSSTGRLLNPSQRLPPFLTTLTPEWGEIYVKHKLYRVDPITRMAMRSCRPFIFAEAYTEATSGVKDYQKQAIAHGFEFGWAVPVHQRDLAPGVVTFGGREEVVLNDAEQFSLFIVSMMAYQRACEFFGKMTPEISIVLTDRERSVLTLVARGKTNWEVGAILSISEYSVRDYLKHLSVKLQTSNRTHSVARAMQLGLIVP